jgi:hypothetical protein
VIEEASCSASSRSSRKFCENVRRCWSRGEPPTKANNQDADRHGHYSIWKSGKGLSQKSAPGLIERIRELEPEQSSLRNLTRQSGHHLVTMRGENR